MAKVTALELVQDRTATSRCDEGFLRLKRLTVRNRRADGTASREYPVDLIDRPALDAVAVAIWARSRIASPPCSPIATWPSAWARVACWRSSTAAATPT